MARRKVLWRKRWSRQHALARVRIPMTPSMDHAVAVKAHGDVAPGTRRVGVAGPTNAELPVGVVLSLMTVAVYHPKAGHQQDKDVLEVLPPHQKRLRSAATEPPVQPPR